MRNEKSFLKVCVRVEGAKTKWGTKRVPCMQCGSKVRFQASINNHMVCKSCYEEYMNHGYGKEEK